MKKFSSLKKPLIYLITDGEATAENFTLKKAKILKLVETAVQFNISLIQIREKRLSARLLFELVAEAAKFTHKSATKLLVNDRADIALAAKADGVHLTSQSLSAETVRRAFPESFIVGVSAHTIEQSVVAKSQMADFVTFSPIFSSPGKGTPQEIEKLGEVCRKLNPFPVLGLGGVAETNYAKVLGAGASGFAAIRFLNDEMNLKKLSDDLRRQSPIKK